MKTTIKAKKKEAIERMQALKMAPDAIRDFSNKGTVMVSEGKFGALYDVDECVKEIIKDFEEKYDALVYTVVHSFTEFGELYDLLYVCDSEEEWEMDREDLKDFYAISGCYNISDGFYEIGTIGVRPVFGGLVRIE